MLYQMEVQSRFNQVYLQYLLHAEILTDFLHGKTPYELREEIRNSPNPFQFALNEPVFLLYMKLKPGTSGGYKLNFHRKIVELTLFLHQSLNGKFLISLVDIDSDTIVAFLQLSAENRGKLFVAAYIYIKECLNDHILSPKSLPFQIFMIMIQEEIAWNQTGKIFDQLQNYYLNVLLPQFPQYGSIVSVNKEDLIQQFPASGTSLPPFPQNTIHELNLHLHSSNSEEIANSVNYNSSYVSRYFKQMTGQSISQYIVQLRIDQAKKYLMSTNDSIQDISVKLGFESPQYFSLVFKKYTGFSPRTYRQNTDCDS